MYRILYLFIAFILAFIGQTWITDAKPLASYVLRDGLILTAIGALFFSWHALPLPRPALLTKQSSWPLTGRLLFGLGILCALFGGLLFIFGSPDNAFHSMRTTIWMAGIMFLLVGIFWSDDTQEYEPPAYRWQLDGAGKFVRMALPKQDDESADGSGRTQMAWYGQLIWLILIMAVGGLLRFWKLGTLPGSCIDAECTLGLRLLEGTGLLAISEVGGIFHLFDFIARALFAWLEDGAYSLRLTSAILGTLTLPAFYGAVRHYTHGPGALLGTLLLALSPWHIWASRSADTWIVLPLLICVTIWALFSAYRQADEGYGSDRRWWGIAAIAAGLLLMEAMPLIGATGLWIVAGLLISLIAFMRSGGTARIAPLILLIGTIAVAAPTLGTVVGQSLDSGRWLTLPTHSLGWRESGRALLDMLLWGNSEIVTVNLFANSALLSLLTATLTVLGLLYLLWRLYNPKALLALSGLVLFGFVAMRVDTQQVSVTSLLLPVGIFLFIGATVALDQLLYTIQHAWRSVLRPAPLVAVGLIALLLFSGRDAQGMMGQLTRLRSSVQTPINAAIGRYMAECVNDDCPPNENGPTPTISGNGVVFVPPSILTHSETQLQVGGALDAGRIQPLVATNEMLMGQESGRDLLYLVPNPQNSLLDQLRQLYPNGVSVPYFAGEEDVSEDPDDQQIVMGQQLFTAYQVSAEESAASNGLSVFFTSRNTAGSGAVRTNHNGPLSFSWNSPESMARPFSVAWQGTLIVPEAGNYTFFVELDPPPADSRSGDLFTLHLDDIVLLDTSLGLTAQPQTLAKGAYHLDMNYRGRADSGDDVISSVVVRWLRPDGITEVIPAEQLVRTRLPYMGLLGTYYPNEFFQEPALQWRKDLLIDAQANCLLQDCGDGNQLQPPYSVRWQGKLAATRAGEYMLASVTDGYNQVFVNGRLVLDNRFSSGDEVAEEGSVPGYQEALLYLDIGWHSIDVRYLPLDDVATSPQLQLLWQPPGGTPSGLDSRYLAPIMAEIYPNDVILPPKTEVVNPSFRDEDFVLSVLDEARQPSVILPPSGLPPLALQPVWQTESVCGSADDQLNYPHGIALDIENERLYVADTANRRIVAYTLDGEVDEIYTTDAFEEPFAVSVTTSGQPFVLDSVSQQIFRLDLETGALEPIPLQTGFYRPRGFDVDLDGGLFYVADTGGARVVVINDEGREVAVYGGRGSQLGYGQPGDVVVTQNAVWVATTEDGRLWRMDSFGEQPQPSLSIAERSGSLDGPRFTALPDGSFFMSDPARKTIFYHARSGQPLSQFAYQDVFEKPVGVAAAVQDGQVYLAVSDSMRCSLSLWEMPQTRLGY